ncbi:MAG: DNA-binding response regulator, partial [Flammeovirgaceae bacterium]
FGILAKVRTAYPSLLVLMLTMYDDDHLIAKAKLAKANGYLLKNISSIELFDALKKLNHSSFYEDPKAFLQRSKVVGQRDSFVEKMKLTKREAEIVTLVAKGKDAITISEELYLSENTVLTHKKNIMKKLELASTADLVRFAFENKLV